MPHDPNPPRNAGEHVALCTDLNDVVISIDEFNEGVAIAQQLLDQEYVTLHT